VLVAASDTSGTIADEEGLDLAALIALKDEGRPLRDYGRGRKLGMDAVIAEKIRAIQRPCLPRHRACAPGDADAAMGDRSEMNCAGSMLRRTRRRK
jgi:hypothetical protein